MSIRNLLIIIIFIVSNNTLALRFVGDTSKISFGVTSGLNFYAFNNDLLFGTNTDGLLFTIGNSDKVSFLNGINCKIKITPRKKLENTFFYSNSYMPYYYQTKDFNNKILVEKYGNIDFNTASINANINYKVYKFFSVHYGLNATYILKEKIDDEAIGKRVNWLDNNSNSNLRKKLNFGLNFGFGISFLKRFKFEYNFTAGKTNFIYLYADNFKANYIAEKVRATSLTLSYIIK
jgi:hypothetical protein